MNTIIYGAGAYGGLTKKILASQGVKVAAFADKKLAGEMKEHTPVISPENIPDNSNEIIYIAVKNNYGEIRNCLKNKGCINIQDISNLLDIDESALPDNLTEREKDAWAQRKTYDIAVKMADISGIKFNHVEAVVTQRCTLRCRDCSSLMPLYKNPSDVDLEKMYEWIISLMKQTAYVGELRILGGEPFLHKGINMLIDKVSSIKNIGILSVYTNGMVFPSTDIWDALQKHNVHIHISDYGYGNNARVKFLSECKNRHINHFVRRYDSWYHMGPLVDNGYDAKKLKDMFSVCISASCPTILNGKLYQCPRAAHAEGIGKIFCKDSEKVDLAVLYDKEILKRITERKSCISTCRYCLGTNDGVVEAAIQDKYNDDTDCIRYK